MGLIWQPSYIRGLRVSVDYTESARRTAIATLGVQDVLDLEATDTVIANRVQRTANGDIVFVDATNINLLGIRSKTVTYGLEKRWEAVRGGQLIVIADATEILSYKQQVSVATPAQESVKRVGGPISSNWNANAQLRWDRDFYSVGWSTKYYDDVLVSSGYDVVEGRDRAPWKLEHDVFASLRFSGRDLNRWDSVLAGTTVSLGIKNVFDRTPRLSAANAVMGTVLADSLLGRRVWVQLRKEF